MNDSGAVRGVERGSGLRENVENLIRIQLFAAQTRPQSFARNVFGGDKPHVFDLSAFVNRQNVRMIERGRGAGFLQKSANVIWIAGKFGGKNFQRDESFEFDIEGEKNFARAARAEFAFDAVTPELLCGSEAFALSDNRFGDFANRRFIQKIIGFLKRSEQNINFGA